jgi:hypothetical protein
VKIKQNVEKKILRNNHFFLGYRCFYTDFDRWLHSAWSKIRILFLHGPNWVKKSQNPEKNVEKKCVRKTPFFPGWCWFYTVFDRRSLSAWLKIRILFLTWSKLSKIGSKSNQIVEKKFLRKNHFFLGYGWFYTDFDRWSLSAWLKIRILLIIWPKLGKLGSKSRKMSNN